MKKAIIPTICAAALFFTGCGNKQSVIPSQAELQSSLKANNYVAEISTQDVDGSVLSAKSGDNFLEVYRLNSAEECNRVYQVVSSANPNAEQLYQLTDDAEFGNVIICGTKEAVKQAGIKIVSVKVKT